MDNSKKVGISVLTVEAALAICLAAAAGVGAAHWGLRGGETLVASAGGAVAVGVLGNFVDRLLVRTSQVLGDLLPRRRRDGLCINHDLARAIRAAEIAAVKAVCDATMVEEAAHAEGDRTAFSRRSDLEAFRRRIRRWARSAERQLDHKRQELSDLDSIRLLSRVLPQIILPPPADSDAGRAFDWVIRTGAGSVLTELDRSVGWKPACFVDALLESQFAASHVSWSEAFRSFFLEVVKTDQAVYRIVSLELMVHGLRDLARGRSLASAKPRLLDTLPASGDHPWIAMTAVPSLLISESRHNNP